MPGLKHVHRYYLTDIGVNREVIVYQCAESGCVHYMPQHMQQQYLKSKCWNCNEVILIDTQENKRVYPKCNECEGRNPMVENNEKLSGVYKELWMQYQTDEMKDISELTYDELVERILRWESIEFEARAKRQKDIAEKRVRDNKRLKESRDALISDPHYTPKDSPTKPTAPYKVKSERVTKEDRLKTSLGDLGIDLGDLLGDIKTKKLDGVKELKGSMSNGKGE